MPLTPDDLLTLGFTEIPHRPTRWAYQGITGRLHQGVFSFHGFNPPIASVVDLQYMVRLINYHYQASVVGYPGSASDN